MCGGDLSWLLLHATIIGDVILTSSLSHSFLYIVLSKEKKVDFLV